MHGLEAPTLIFASVFCRMALLLSLPLGSRRGDSGSDSVSTVRQCCCDLVTTIPSWVRIEVDSIIVRKKL